MKTYEQLIEEGNHGDDLPEGFADKIRRIEKLTSDLNAELDTLDYGDYARSTLYNELDPQFFELSEYLLTLLEE